MTLKINARYIWICLFLAVGLLWRVLLASQAVKEPIWDMSAYNELGQKMVSGQLSADCCNHGLGYPLVLAVIYKIFGADNLGAVRIFQILVDLGVSLVVYFIAKYFFSAKASWWAFILYIINPFTASYTGLVLTEVTAIALISLIGLTLVQKDFSKSSKLWLILGMLLGFLAITKIALSYFTLGFGGLLWIITSRKLKLVFIFVLGYLIAAGPQIIANYRTYRLIRILPAYRTSGGVLYANYFMPQYPELASEFDEAHLSQTYRQLSGEYFDLYQYSPQLMPAFDRKYKRLFWEKTRREWPTFLKNTFRNSLLIWDKRFLLLYVDPFYPQDRWPTRFLNIGLIAAASFGFISYRRSVGIKPFLRNPFVLFSMIFLLYISTALAMVSNESRLSIPFYPLLFVWAGKGMQSIRLRRKPQA